MKLPRPPLLLVAAATLLVVPIRATSLDAGVSTAYTAVINFDRADYYVDGRFVSKGTPTTSMARLETNILFNPLVPDAAGNIALPTNFADQVARMKAGSPAAAYTLGIGSLTAIVGNATAQANFNAQLQTLVTTHGFRGIDLDWEDMPNAPATSAANYAATVKAVSDVFRPQGIIMSTSHAQGDQYKTYVQAVKGSVDFVNLQFYFSTSNAMSLATFKAQLADYVTNTGIAASQLRIGLPSYGMIDKGVSGTSDQWRSWDQLIAKGADVVNGTTFTDTNGETYYYSGLNLIRDKIDYAKANGFAGVFTWELTQDGNYSGTNSINRAIDERALNSVPVLELNDTNNVAGALGTGAVTLGTGAVLNNGILRFARTAAATHANRIDGYGSIEVTGAGAVTLTGANTYTGGTTIGTGATLQVGDNTTSGAIGTGAVVNNGTLTLARSDTYEVANAISGTGTLRKRYAGAVTLSGDNSYTGATTLLGGTTRVTTLANGGANSSLGASSNAAGNLVFNGGALTYVGASAATTDRLFTLNTSATLANDGAGALTFSNTGAIAHTNTGAARTLTLGGSNAGANTFASGIGTTGGAGLTSLTKTGTGRWIVSGANTYTGGTAVNVGTLLVNNTTGSGLGTTGTVSVAASATLGGTGAYSAGLTTVHGTLLGGDGASASGTLTVGGAVTLAAGSTVALALGAGGAHATLAFTGAETFATAQQFTFLDLGATTGTYAGLITGVAADPTSTAGWSITNAGWSGTFAYNGTTQAIDLTLTAIPEPSTYGLLGAGALATVALVRRRRRHPAS